MIIVKPLPKPIAKPLAALLVACVGVLLAGCGTPDAEASAARELRVCADPNSLPYSNEREEGFENRIATLLADEMDASLTYVWWPQRRGFIRNTLRDGLCDVVMGLPTSMEMALPSRPYYRSTYVFLTRADSGIEIAGLDDPVLHDLRIGLHLIGDDYSNSPAAAALAQRGMLENLIGYSVYGDYAQPNPPARLVSAVSAGEVDVAIVWGPIAGYFASVDSVPMVMTPVTPEVDLPFIPFVYDISVAVERSDTTLMQEVEAAIAARQAEIDSILVEYGVPFARDGPAGRRGSL